MSDFLSVGCLRVESMNEQDRELLARYAREGCEGSFAELVRRHIDLVWGAAWRITGDADLSKDISQRVFSDLAAKARILPEQVSIPGWLYRASVLAAKKTVRTNLRRARREAEAMDSQITPSTEPADELIPLLDEALQHLPERDRSVVVLRFFARKSLAEIGKEFAISEDAAQKRVSRALDRLKVHFQGQGRTLTAGTLAATLTAASVAAAPAGVAASIAAVSCHAVALGGAWPALVEQLTLMKTKLIFTGAALIAVGTPLVMQQQTLAALERQRAELEVATPVNSIPAAQRQLAAEWAQYQRDLPELERLRAESARFRAAGISPELQRELAELRQQLVAAQSGTKLASDSIQANQLREQTVSAMKQLGLAARIFANEHGESLPQSFLQIRGQLGPDPVLPAGMSLERFEFVEHERLIKETEPELILIREKEPRKQPDGKWARAYTLGDGSVQQITFDTEDFSEWESKRIGRREAE
jgi:RNA polymerase sigma factor (sigma-70 family)